MRLVRPGLFQGCSEYACWEDSARALGGTATADRGAKPALDVPAADRRQDTSVPLDACYVLRPIDPVGPAARERLSEVCAALACVSFSKLGSLAGGEEAIATLDRAPALLARSPCTRWMSRAISADSTR